MSHSAAMTAITCPTVNSYNGLVPHVGGCEGSALTWAPTNITYGYNSRSAQFRLPQNRFCIENRACDMIMNVYLAMAMHLACMVKGIKNKIEPGQPSDFDLYEKTEAELSEMGILGLPPYIISGY